MPGVSLEQPEHDVLVVHDHTLVPAGCLDTLSDFTDAIAGRTRGNVTSGEIHNVGRACVLALPRQTVGKPIRLAGSVIKNLREAQTFELPRGLRALVSLRVVAVDNHRTISLQLCGCLAVEVLEWDVDRPRYVLCFMLLFGEHLHKLRSAFNHMTHLVALDFR
jgi:hypothetical protein